VSDELVTGRRAVVEALRAGQVKEVLVAVGARDTQGLRAVREAARAAKVPVRATTPR
jgi:ribosomal protein L7Ae-like RNA K-turn-binding protein